MCASCVLVSINLIHFAWALSSPAQCCWKSHWKMELSVNDENSKRTHVRRICMRFIRWRVAFKLELVKWPNVEIRFVSNTSSHNATGWLSGSDVTKNDKSKNRFENQQVQIACILKCPFAIWIYFNIQNWEERERAHFAYIPYDNYSNRLYQFEETKEGSKENGWMDGWTGVLVRPSVGRSFRRSNDIQNRCTY